MSDKVIALRTLMVRGIPFLQGQQVPFLEKVQLERLVEAGAVEVIKEKKTRKKRATKTPRKQTQVIDEIPSDNHTPLEVVQEEEKSEVVEGDTISLDQLDF